MFSVVCVREDLFNRFGSEESADQRMSSGQEDGEAHCSINKLLFHLGASIAGQFHSSCMARVSGSGPTVCCAGGAKKRFEQSPLEGVPVEEKFRMPLDAQKEAVGRRFDRLHDTIGGQGAGDQ